MRDEQSVLHEVYYLTGGTSGYSNWRKLLVFGNKIEQQLKRKLLWVWPTKEDLLNCHHMLDIHGINNILSIGCGSGLLEWLLLAAASVERRSKITLHGLEVDRNWWQSKYAIQSFIPLQYVEDNVNPQHHDLFDQHMDGHCDALLFCYFNNRPAFLDYLRCYQGNWLILIGPKPGRGIHTDPNPLQPRLPSHQWTLEEQLNWTEDNIVAFYKRSSV